MRSMAVVQLLSLALLAVRGGAQSLGSTGTLTVHNKFLAPDGFNRSAVVVNGVHPAPLIKANKGERFTFNVVNQLEDDTMLRSTSIHWHGLLQRGSAWADGAAAVSQCPISPGNSFEYRFGADGHAGTFWYHSHFGTQYCDGLRGPLVIYDNDDPHRHLYEVDDENTIITLADWYHLPAPSLMMPAFADATLINGKGRTTTGPKAELAIVNIERGKRYRFRLVSLSCEPNFQFSIDGHQMTIIEADGHATEPITVDRLRIFAGQRYSFVLEANQPVGNYWMRALPNFGNNGLNLGYLNDANTAILRYAGAPEANPRGSPPVRYNAQLDEAMLRPLVNPAAPGRPVPGGADVNVRLDFGFNVLGLKYTVNGTSYKSPTVPVLLQIMSGAKTASELLPEGSLVTLPRNAVVEVTVPGGLIGGPHPFHLHGHSFSVVKTAESKTYNFENPVRRDVVHAGERGEDTVIRFVTDNPGPWLFHCHVEFHMANGLAIVFAEDVDSIAEANPVPESWSNLCPVYNALPASMTSVSKALPNLPLPINILNN
ncbi:laccase 4 [Coprinopsis sp. MPI-PUGE-AT-0042]|nr:laccase 4 [Coprinopsis sp. MPI-PUGE-AT-0042]